MAPMQVLNVSYNDPQVRRAIDAACGRPFGFWEAVRKGGTGSARFALLEAPTALLSLVDRAEDRGYCSLEARRAGLLLRMRSRLETLAVPIGSGQLVEAVLGSPGECRRAPLLFVLCGGERLLFGIHREQWGGMRSLLQRSLPADRFRLSASSRL